MNNADAVVSHYNENLDIQVIRVHHSEVNDAPKEKIGFWKILKEFKKLKKTLKKDFKGINRGPRNGKLLIAWGLLLMAVPLVAMLVTRTATLTGWIFPLMLLAGLIMLIVGLIRWAKDRRI